VTDEKIYAAIERAEELFPPRLVYMLEDTLLRDGYWKPSFRAEVAGEILAMPERSTAIADELDRLARELKKPVDKMIEQAEYEDAHDGHAMRGEAYGRDFAAEELKRRATELRGK
jgi:hypothetical protein